MNFLSIFNITCCFKTADIQIIRKKISNSNAILNPGFIYNKIVVH